MHRTLLLILLLFFAAAPAAVAQEVMALLSARLQPYAEALAGFRREVETSVASGRGPRSILPVQVSSLVLNDTGETRAAELIAADRPDLLLAVGSSALALTRQFPDIPTVFCLVPPGVAVGGNATGVLLEMMPQSQLAALRQTLPQARRVGVLYNPESHADFIRRAQKAAAALGLTLDARPVARPTEVSGRLISMGKTVDVFWMLPDRTVVTPQTVETIFLFSFKNRVPVLTFSDKYLELGAAVSTSFDTEAMGRQAGLMARAILAGRKPAELTPQPAKAIRIRVNGLIGEKLGITIKPQAELQGAPRP